MSWLRVLTVFAAFCLILYFYLRPEPLMTPVYWNLFFIALNLYWAIRLGTERLRPEARDRHAFTEPCTSSAC